jgi:hypothetical protein
VRIGGIKEKIIINNVQSLKLISHLTEIFKNIKLTINIIVEVIDFNRADLKFI